ncbi:MAG: hypothetical protein R3E09_06800 [Novosphingobium sp.]
MTGDEMEHGLGLLARLMRTDGAEVAGMLKRLTFCSKDEAAALAEAHSWSKACRKIFPPEGCAKSGWRNGPRRHTCFCHIHDHG